MLNMLTKWSGLALLWMFAVLPHVCLRSLANLSAWITWHVNGRLRRVTERNLEISFPDLSKEARTRFARKSLQELCLGILEMGRIWLWRPERLLKNVTRVVGKEHLDAALANGNGTLVLVPHLGSWEIAYYYLAKRYPLTTMFQESKSTTFSDFVYRARQRCGVKLVSTGRGGLRTLLKSLKAGEIISLLPDQVPQRDSGIFAPFFGEPTLTMTLATNLLHRTNARALCGYCKRTSDGNYEIVFLPPDAAIYDPDCATAVAGLNKSIERCVMDCPEQYQWQYKRFKFLPGLVKRDYMGDDNDQSKQLRHRRA